MGGMRFAVGVILFAIFGQPGVGIFALYAFLRFLQF
jgi:hypothetical protein